MKIVKDPVYGYINILDNEIKLIDQSFFQRLRYIKQLGYSYLVYPSSDHSRFQHSLGTMQVASDMFVSLMDNWESKEDTKNWLSDIKTYFTNKYGVKKNISDYRLIGILHKIIRISALLHDVGHLPFSHSFEDGFKWILFSKADLYQNIEKNASIIENFEKFNPNIPIHEFVSHKIIIKYASEFIINGKELGEWVPKFIVNVFEMKIKCSTINECELEHDDQKEHVFAKLFMPLQKLINGPLDADRLDYVLRDSLQSGIQIGSFERERILRNMSIVKNQDTYDIIFSIKAASAVSAFLTLRHQLYRNLYHHPTVALFDTIYAIIMEIMIKDSFNIANKYKMYLYYRVALGELHDDENFQYRKLIDDNDFGFHSNDPLVQFHDISWETTLRKYVAQLNLERWQNQQSIQINYITQSDTKIFKAYQNLFSLITDPYLLFFGSIGKRNNLPIAIWKNYSQFKKIVIEPIIDVIKNKFDQQYLDDLLNIEITTADKNNHIKRFSKQYFETKELKENVYRYIAEEIVIDAGFNFDLSKETTTLGWYYDLAEDLFTIIKQESEKNEELVIPINILMSTKPPKLYKQDIHFTDFKENLNVDLKELSPLVNSLTNKLQDKPYFYTYFQSTEDDRLKLRNCMQIYQKIISGSIVNWLERKPKTGNHNSNIEFILEYHGPDITNISI